jgi:hypothetical protein
VYREEGVVSGTVGDFVRESGIEIQELFDEISLSLGGEGADLHILNELFGGEILNGLSLGGALCEAFILHGADNQGREIPLAWVRYQIL